MAHPIINKLAKCCSKLTIKAHAWVVRVHLQPNLSRNKSYGYKRKVLTLDDMSVLSSSWTVENLHIRLLFDMDVVKHKYWRSTLSRRASWKSGNLVVDQTRNMSSDEKLYEDMNTVVWEWLCTVRSKNLPVSGRLIQEKALMLSVTMNHDNFTASNGWLESWQKRYGV